MKLTFCAVDLPENQDIETLEFESYGLLKTEASKLMRDEFKKNTDFVAVIWEEITDSEGISRGECFQICHSPFYSLASILDFIYENHSNYYFEGDLNDGNVVNNFNIHVAVFCFATFEEALEYTKDYCQGVWPSAED
jgi:hypothetical protein